LIGVTFDFWDCMAADDTDEPKRKAQGLAPKPAARKALFVDELLAHHPELGASRAGEAFDTAVAAFRHAWKVEHHTPSVADRLAVGYRTLHLDPTPGFDTMVNAFERMEVDIPPDPAPGIAEALDAIAGRYPVGIISDAIVTPGHGLREILQSWGLLKHFRTTVFSDEAGAAKPSPKVFHRAAAGLGVTVTDIVHIGDRESNDVAGPNGVGARGVLYTGVIDRGSEHTAAAAVCRHHNELPAVLAALER
jgi:FMN phosphatase YigB (HAD superfamily)